MQDLVRVKKFYARAKRNYQTAKEKLEESREDASAFSLAAQRANDAWLEFKKADVEMNNCLTLKKLGDLYGC